MKKYKNLRIQFFRCSKVAFLACIVGFRFCILESPNSKVQLPTLTSVFEKSNSKVQLPTLTSVFEKSNSKVQLPTLTFSKVLLEAKNAHFLGMILEFIGFICKNPVRS